MYIFHVAETWISRGPFRSLLVISNLSNLTRCELRSIGGTSEISDVFLVYLLTIGHDIWTSILAIKASLVVITESLLHVDPSSQQLKFKSVRLGATRYEWRHRQYLQRTSRTEISFRFRTRWFFMLRWSVTFNRRYILPYQLSIKRGQRVMYLNKGVSAA